MLYLQLQKSLQKPTLTVVEMQKLQDIKKTVSLEKVFCLKGTMFGGRRKK